MRCVALTQNGTQCSRDGFWAWQMCIQHSVASGNLPADAGYSPGDRVRFQIGRHPERVGTVECVGIDYLLVRLSGFFGEGDRCPTNAPKYSEIIEVL